MPEQLYWPGLDAAAEAMLKKCPMCQHYKTAVKKYKKISLPRNEALLPWEVVHVDLIGPWPVQYTSDRNQKTMTAKIQALTIFDKATKWPEFEAMRNKLATI